MEGGPIEIFLAERGYIPIFDSAQGNRNCVVSVQVYDAVSEVPLPWNTILDTKIKRFTN
jgi:hypothetical protein